MLLLLLLLLLLLVWVRGLKLLVLRELAVMELLAGLAEVLMLLILLKLLLRILRVLLLWCVLLLLCHLDSPLVLLSTVTTGDRHTGGGAYTGADIRGAEWDVWRNALMMNVPRVIKSSTTLKAAVAVPTLTHVPQSGWLGGSPRAGNFKRTSRALAK
jgi:hypothetical protein